MTEIYTPKEWRSLFSCPSIVIDDNRYIYPASEYKKLLRTPIGRIDYAKNNIYGKDYASWLATPMAYMVKNDCVTKVQIEKTSRSGFQPKPNLFSAPPNSPRPSAPRKQQAGSSQSINKIFGSNKKFTKCPYCRTNFFITVPVGTKHFATECPNKLCRKQLIVNL